MIHEKPGHERHEHEGTSMKATSVRNFTLVRKLVCRCGLLLLMAGAVPAQAMRCGNDLTHGGDYEFQVRNRCGAPLWVEDHYKIERIGNKEQSIEREVHFTDWYYNFGASQFMVHVQFRDGQLVSEEKLGRGVDEVGSACDSALRGHGFSSGELVAYCGEPASRNTHAGAITRRIASGVHETDEVDREEWIYDLGGDWVYVAHLYDSRLNYVERRRR